MDALHPRLLTTRFAQSFAFYEAVLPELLGATLMRGDAAGPYAHWDGDGQGILSLFDAGMMAAAVGSVDVDAAKARDSVIFICRVADVDSALALCLRHGATLAADAADRPQWGPNLRTAHVRDPDGVLIELQSY
ncbi:hypothetical protein Pth03_69830 [Planotetraspora thailandica]|uniref:Glyoxalase/fosfomycin resistance/dioxygenase domain-containing protein n=1 Tax=Planotetraspora thailandica TaxID=487172 RepID=A0A8J3Y0M3_9ACTN|nr:VOC family protein [Planotetraspora thailandica]GII58594.1 hypothetical protein Pth03_69830 [Planotetraspora thailandica]